MLKDRKTILVLGGSCAVLVIIAVISFLGTFRNAYEVASIRLFPSAGRAYEYGSMHFDAKNAGSYDIELAAYFLREAEKLDPQYPYLQHQLARVAFLNGDFPTAISHINKEIELYGDMHANSFYVRGLILGFMGKYDEAANDYKHYLEFEQNWAGINDYAWVLLKAGRAKDAAVATAEGLKQSPGNPWLLNSNAIALYEIGEVSKAREQARLALLAVMHITEDEWLKAYPGNDPRIAQTGILAFQESVRANMHMINLAIEKGTYNEADE